jgi:hypothetical protein
MVQFDADFHFLQNGTTTTLYDALTPLPWPYFVFHLLYGANYFSRQIFNIAFNTWQNAREHAPLISNSSNEDVWYFAIIRRRLNSNDALPSLKTCGIALAFAVLTRAL